MATTRIISLHGRKGQSIAQTLRDRINYAENSEKTDGGRLVSSYECSPAMNLPHASTSTKPPPEKNRHLKKMSSSI